MDNLRSAYLQCAVCKRSHIDYKLPSLNILKSITANYFRPWLRIKLMLTGTWPMVAVLDTLILSWAWFSIVLGHITHSVGCHNTLSARYRTSWPLRPGWPMISLSITKWSQLISNIKKIPSIKGHQITWKHFIFKTFNSKQPVNNQHPSLFCTRPLPCLQWTVPYSFHPVEDVAI